MTDQIQITLDRAIYDKLRLLMVPPVSDANAVIAQLLYEDGGASPAAIALEADEQHFTYAEELARASQGVYEFGGCT